MELVGIALLFNLLDLITGIIGALKDGESIQSSKLRDGLFKKVGFILCYALGIAIGVAENYYTLPFGVDVLPIICGYAIVTEVVSIIENISKINPDILPEKLKSLIGYNDKGSE